MMFQIFFIVLDRALYLKRVIRGKFLFQFANVLIMHLVIFTTPFYTGYYFIENAALRRFYLLQCLCFGISALQLRWGYDSTSQASHFITKHGYTAIPAAIYKVYRAVPFVFELRSVLDWVCAETSLDLFMWLKLEDMYANLYLIRAQVQAKLPKAQIYSGNRPMPMIPKLTSGGVVFFLLVFVLIGPIYMFSTANPALTPNPVLGSSIVVGIQGAEGNNEYVELFRSSPAVYVEDMSLEDYQSIQRLLPRQLDTKSADTAQV